MQKPALKLDVFIAHPSYGGNGGISSEHPDLREWEVETVQKMKADPRVGRIHTKTIGDTPITMVRNKFVQLAREAGAHLLLMVDSDQSPDKHKGEGWWRPFWDVAFDEIYRHYQAGPLVIGAPYGGPPPYENVYIFRFQDHMWAGDETRFDLDQYTRAEAARMTGVGEVAALPTGCILFDMRAFELIEPPPYTRRQILEMVQKGEVSADWAEMHLSEGWFYYEWTDNTASEKASTEDVTVTRDIALAGVAELGYNPLRCAWDSWVGHHKPWNVGKPALYTADQIGATYRRAVLRNQKADEATVDLGVGRLAEIGIDQSRIENAPSNGTPPANGHVPAEVLEFVPEALHKDLHVRTLPNGKQMVTFLEMTPDEHLVRLAEIVNDHSRHFGLAPRFIRVVEVGSWLGASALMLSDYCGQVFCVDNFTSTDDVWRETIEKFGGPDFVRKLFEYNTRDQDNIYLIAHDSVDAAEQFDEKVDVIFIDANHSYEDVRADIKAWLPHLKADGLMIGHDYGNGFEGVEKAVRECLGDSYRYDADSALWWTRAEFFSEVGTTHD